MPELNPVDIERKMRQLVGDLALAQLALAEARNTEVDCKHKYERKRRRLILSKEGPVVGRGEGQVTSPARAAWIDLHCEEEEQVYDVAVSRREAAADHLRTLRDQAVLVTALAKSVQVSIGLSGRDN